MDKLYKEQEILDYLKISRTTLWRFKSKGLPAIKVGKSNRYKIEDVEHWVANETLPFYATAEKKIKPKEQKREKKSLKKQIKEMFRVLL